MSFGVAQVECTPGGTEFTSMLSLTGNPVKLRTQQREDRSDADKREGFDYQSLRK